jgi:hypothetical protein
MVAFTFFVGRSVGGATNLGAAGMDNVAFKGFDSPFSFEKKTVTGYFLPDIEVFKGTSNITFSPTKSPSIA